MARNPDFEQIVTPELELVYPRLDQPYRFNEREKRTEPCQATAPQAAWSVAVRFDKADAKGLHNDLQNHYGECRKRNDKLPEFSKVFGMKTEDDGTVLVTFRHNCMTRDGEPAKGIKVIGPDHQDLADKRIWSGSKGRVRAVAFPSVNPQDGAGGISLMLDAVLVTDAKYGDDGFERDFGPPVDSFAAGEPEAPPAPEPEIEPAF